MNKRANPQDLGAMIPEPRNFIDGAFSHGSGPRQDVIYPATGAAIASVAWSTASDVDVAVAAAKRGFETWRRTSPAARARILNKAARILRERLEQIARVETLDTGKPLQETLAVDVTSGADCLEYFAAQAATLTGEHVGFSGHEGDWGYTRREPLGICAGIGAWNYPIQIACWKSAPALACGNSFIFKPAESTPLSAMELASAYRDAGLPDGVFNIVQGDGSVGAALTAHPDIAKVSLTGSTATGIRILKGAADTLKHVTLELGGKSPFIIFPDADLDSAVGGAMIANFYSTGQVCSNGTRVFVHESVKDAFLSKLVERTARLRIGDPLDPQTNIGPLVSEAHFEKVRSYLEAGRKEAHLVHGGGIPKVAGFEGGYWVEPAIFAVKDESVSICTDEIFGPVMSVIAFRDEEDVTTRANTTGYGLSAGVYTNDMARAHRMMARLDAGTCWINTYNFTPVELPFGGYKRSGIGRENGRWAMDAYSQVKSVYVAMSPPQYPY